MRIVRSISQKASVFPGSKQRLPSPLALPQEFQVGARHAYSLLLQRLVDFEFDRLRELTELTFWRHLKKKVSLLVEDGLEPKLLGSAAESEVSLISDTTHIGAVLPYRNLNPCLFKFDITEASPCEFRYKYRPSAVHSSSFARLCLKNLSRLNIKPDLSDYEAELDHLYSLLNSAPQVIHRREVELNTSLRLQVLDSKGTPVGNSPERQIHRLTFEMLERTHTDNTEATEWFKSNLEQESDCWFLVDVDDCMQGNSLLRCKIT
mmetsp:Transcript_17394/g.31402  ORF Transcript_17394/g.31402 Transcript_17394/m.31402 type:complete len:263 (+) Transcript_17394:702-1490(+)